MFKNDDLGIKKKVYQYKSLSQRISN